MAATDTRPSGLLSGLLSGALGPSSELLGLLLRLLLRPLMSATTKNPTARVGYRAYSAVRFAKKPSTGLGLAR